MNSVHFQMGNKLCSKKMLTLDFNAEADGGAGTKAMEKNNYSSSPGTGARPAWDWWRGEEMKRGGEWFLFTEPNKRWRRGIDFELYPPALLWRVPGAGGSQIVPSSNW